MAGFARLLRMDRNAASRSRSGPAIAALLLVGLLFAYPLSLGPAVLIHHRLQPSPWADKIEKFYAPLENLPEAMKAPLEWWARLWEIGADGP